MNTKRANAVLIPLVEDKDGVCILFEKRSMKVWQPGEICFPGGGIEPGESPQEAAVRETMEELGLARGDIRVLAPFDIQIGRGGFVLHSVVGQLCPQNIQIEPKEVAEVFTVPLQWFVDNPPARYRFPVNPSIPEDFDMSIFGVQNPYPWRESYHETLLWKYGEHHIWGLTAGILDNFIHFILAK